MNSSGSHRPRSLRRHCCVLAVAMLVLVAAHPVSAFITRPHLVHTYNAEDGLPSSGVYSLDQSPDGRMWFVTRNEVAVFDGFDWQTWSAGQDLPPRRLLRVRVDSSGTVRVLIPRHNSPLACWDGERWTLLEGPVKPGSASLEVFDFAVIEEAASEPIIALGTLGDGLWLHDIHGWRQVSVEQGLPGEWVRSVVAHGSGFLVATDGGLARISIDGTVDTSLNRLLPPGARDVLVAALEDPPAGSEAPVIWVLSADRLGRIVDSEYVTGCTGLKLQPTREFRAVLLPQAGGPVYFGTHLELYCCDPGDPAPEPLGRHQGLVNDGATDIRLDREGNVWVSGLRGVSKLVPTPFRSFRQTDGLLEDEVTAVCERRPGRLLFGHTSGLTTLENGTIRTYSLEPGFTLPPGRRRVLDTAADGQGGCWVAGSGLGLVRVSPDFEMTWFGPEDGLPWPVTSVLLMPSGELLVSTETGVFRRKGSRFERPDWAGGPVPPIRRMFQGRDGTIFLATIQDGLWLVRDGRLTVVPGLEAEDELRVTAVQENTDGSAWVGTWAGLFLLQEGRLERPVPPLNQVTDTLFFITRDHQGRLWLGTNDGVLRWDGEALERFGIREGLAGRETNRAAGFVDSQMRIWVGTETGLSLFVGDGPFRNTLPPLVAITDLSAGDGPVELDKPAELGHERNTLVFDYRAVSFIDEAAVRYQYYLEGFDETWLDEVPASTRRARYTNLPAGNYRFHIRAAGVPGTWSESSTSQWVTILKPFWLRWWFFLIVAVVLAQVGYWAVVAGSRKRYALRLSKEVAARTAELEESREHYRLLFHGAAVPKLIIDVEDGVVLDANRAAEELCGLAAGGFPGRRPEEVGPVWLSEMLDLCRNAAVGEEELQVTGQQPLAGGEPRDVEAWGARLTLRGRTCVLVTAMDITGRRRLEIEQLRTSKLDSLGILAGGIAHDFNNMLTAIMGNLSLAREDLPQGSEPALLVEAAITASRNARRLTSQLLTFARGGAPVRRMTDMGKLVREAATLIMSGSSSACEFSIDPALWPAEVDEGQMNQLVNNLVINACQAMPGGGRVTIRARNVAAGEGVSSPPLEGPHLRITVADEGHGIPPDVLGKVFDPYFSTREKGSGLGLATAYAIAKGHGGAITVQSSPGKGALFRVFIPAAPEAAVPERKPEPPVHRGPGRILVMDDEEQILLFYERALTRLGYQPVTTSDGQAAVQLYEESLASGAPFDAVIMDLTIPGGMGGREAVRLLQRLDPMVKVVVASGYSSDPVLSDPGAYGFTAVLPKPFSLRAIADVLKAVLDDPLPPGGSA